MKGRIYTVITGYNSVSGAHDLFSLSAAATSIIALKGLQIGQSSEAGDAEDEMLQVKIQRAVGAFTLGTGGSAATPAPVDQEGAAASFTARVDDDSTQHSGGTTTDLVTDAFNVRAGYCLVLPPDDYIIASPTDAIIVAISAPADAVTFGATAWVEEIGT